MIIKIDEYSDLPIYMQIRNQIVMGISSGELKGGEQLPTVRALALEIGINTMTVSKTYQLLKSEGYIMTDRKNGARVRPDISKSGEISEGSFRSKTVRCFKRTIEGTHRRVLLKIRREVYDMGNESYYVYLHRSFNDTYVCDRIY